MAGGRQTGKWLREKGGGVGKLMVGGWRGGGKEPMGRERK